MRSQKSSVDEFTVQLDTYDGLEALIVNRLMSLDSPIQKKWLRRLLVKGFCADCAEKRALQRGSDAAPTNVPTPCESQSPSDRDAQNCVEVSEAENRMPVPSAMPATSLSALRAVMG